MANVLIVRTNMIVIHCFIADTSRQNWSYDFPCMCLYA
jgi:hypothetical protein